MPGDHFLHDAELVSAEGVGGILNGFTGAGDPFSHFLHDVGRSQKADDNQADGERPDDAKADMVGTIQKPIPQEAQEPPRRYVFAP